MSAPDDNTPRVTAAEAEALLAGLARGRAGDPGGDVWPLYGRAEDLARTVIDLSAEIAAQRDAFAMANAELAAAVLALLAERDHLRAHGAAPNPRYPRGKLNPTDEGATELGVGVEGGAVVVRFPKPMAWFGLGSAEARTLADAILRCVEELRVATDTKGGAP